MNKVVIDTAINTEGIKRGATEIKYSLLKLASKMITFSKLGKAALQGMGNDFKFITSKLFNFKKAMSGMNVGFKQFLKFGLGMKSLFALLNKIRGAIKDGLGNLAKSDNETSASINMLKGSLETLKNAMGAAFAPILNAIAPALNYMIELLTKAANAVGMFFAALTGKGTAVQAVKNTDKLNKSLEKTGKSAKKTKQQLAGIYDLNVINSDKDSGSGSGSSSGGFEVAEIESQISTLAEMLRQAFESGDFTDIGARLAEKISNALANIPWDKIQEMGKRVATSLATFLNGIFGTEELFVNLGKTFGNFINTIIYTGLAFVQNFDWKQAGKSFAIFIKSWIETVDFASLGKLLSDGLKGILDFLINFVETMDWKALGKKVRELLENIDWSGIIGRVATLIGDAFGALVAFVWGVLEDSWNNLIDWWEENAFEDGKFTITGLLNGIWEVLKNIGSWINEHIFQPFSNGFKKAFGLDSSEPLFQNFGKTMMANLLAGIMLAKDTVLQAFELIKQGILTVWQKIEDGIKGFVNNIISAIETMINNVIRGVNKMIEALNALQFDIPDWVPAIGGNKFGLNISTIPEVSLPKLATGAVVPRQASEFAAILGDNNRETEVVSPLSTMKQALTEALAESGIGGEMSVNVYLEGDAKGVFRVVKAEADKYSRKMGKPAFI